MVIALALIGLVLAYIAIGTIVALLVNAIRHRLNPTGYQDEDALRIIFMFWPVAFPFMFLMNSWTIAKHFVDKQDERFHAKRQGILTPEEMVKRIKQLEKDLAEALLLKDK